MKASDNLFPKLRFTEGTAPATPDAGTVVLYAKADGKLYMKDAAGVETDLSDIGAVPDADAVAFDNAASGLAATNVQDAIDEVAAAGGGGSDTLTIVTESGAFTAAPAAHAGLRKYVRAGGNVTFNTSQSYTAGEVFNIRATGAVTLVGTGVTLTEPSGGTLGLTAGMSVTVVMTSSSAADVIGQTVPA